MIANLQPPNKLSVTNKTNVRSYLRLNSNIVQMKPEPVIRNLINIHKNHVQM